MGKQTNTTMQQRTDRRYWLYETPEIFETGRNAIRYFKKAGKIQIAAPDYVEAHKSFFDGEMEEVRKPGKLCALDLFALSEDPETLRWLIGILKSLED